MNSTHGESYDRTDVPTYCWTSLGARRHACGASPARFPIAVGFDESGDLWHPRPQPQVSRPDSEVISTCASRRPEARGAPRHGDVSKLQTSEGAGRRKAGPWLRSQWRAEVGKGEGQSFPSARTHPWTLDTLQILPMPLEGLIIWGLPHATWFPCPFPLEGRGRGQVLTT